MNNSLTRILLCIGEILLGTVFYSLLDYFFDNPIDIVYNLISVTVIVLLCNTTDYIIKKIKNKK